MCQFGEGQMQGGRAAVEVGRVIRVLKARIYAWKAKYRGLSLREATRQQGWEECGRHESQDQQAREFRARLFRLGLAVALCVIAVPIAPGAGEASERTLHPILSFDRPMQCDAVAPMGPTVTDGAWLHLMRTAIHDPQFATLPSVRVHLWARPVGRADQPVLQLTIHRSLRKDVFAHGLRVPLEIAFFSGAGSFEVVLAVDDERGAGCSGWTTVSTANAGVPAPRTPALAPGEMEGVAVFLSTDRRTGVLPSKLPNGLRVLYLVNVDKLNRSQPWWSGAGRFAAPLGSALANHPATASLAITLFSMEDQKLLHETPFLAYHRVNPLYLEDFGVQPGLVDFRQLSTDTEHEFLVRVLHRQKERMQQADVVVVGSPLLPWKALNLELLSEPLREAGHGRLRLADTHWGKKRSKKLRDGLWSAGASVGGKELELAEFSRSSISKAVDKALRAMYAMPRKRPE